MWRGKELNLKSKLGEINQKQIGAMADFRNGRLLTEISEFNLKISKIDLLEM